MCFSTTQRGWLLLMEMWLAQNMLVRQEVSESKALCQLEPLGRNCEKCCVLRGDNSTVFLFFSRMSLSFLQVPSHPRTAAQLLPEGCRLMGHSNH